MLGPVSLCGVPLHSNDSDIDRELQSYGPVPPNPSIVGRTCCPCLITRNTSSTEVIVSMTGRCVTEWCHEMIIYVCTLSVLVCMSTTQVVWF